MLIKVSELRDMEVINIQDGRRLGLIMDIEMDLDEGYITGLILPDEPITGITALFRSSREIFIDFEQIVKIGIDVILVDLNMNISAKKPAFSDERALT